jgi:gamma-glutamyl-gamma-aminobutyrate hydrolase PuuD
LRIAISQREEAVGGSGLTHDCLAQVWYSFLKKHEIIPIPNVVVDRDYDFDMLILSGGNASLARLHTELKLYNYALDNNKPILGICHGAFFLCELTGGTCGDIEGHRGTEHVITMDGHNTLVNSYHGSNIITVGKDYDPIAVDMDGNIEGFKHKTKPIWGIVWHPEMMEVPVLPKEIDEMLDINNNVFNHIPDWMNEV